MHLFFFQAEDGIRDRNVTGVQTCALPISRCDEAELKKHQIRGASLSSHPDATELTEITKLIDAGKIRPIVTEVLPLTDAAKAVAQAQTHHTRGKLVLKIADEPKG